MTADDHEMYQERILAHYEQPFHRGHCSAPTHAHEDDNPLCGDFVHIELSIDPEGRIQEAYFDGDGCCISQASASMLMERVVGQSLDDVRSMTPQQMLELLGAKLTPNRQKCCLLPWRVLQTAMFSPTSGAAETPNTSGD